jgi:DNA-binding NarL/FixJ family response regulator
MPKPHEQPVKKVIALIDDDHQFLRDYSRGLNWFCKTAAAFEIRAFSEPSAALEFIRSEWERVELYVVDSMMAHEGEFSTDETKAGLYTGVALIREIKKIHPNNHKVRFVILTNVDSNDLKPLTSQLNIDDILSKTHWHPKRFADYVDKLLRP